ncbi:hypothetical protein AgCh_033411 [Apium graveolens]
MYMMKELRQKESWELFSYHAFRKSLPPVSFLELSVSLVDYVGGHPLALKALGSSLRDAGIPVLVERFLLRIDEDNKFQMHNLIQDMGREVIREEYKHGKCLHLHLCRGNALEAFQNLEGTDKIEGLVDLTPGTQRHVSAKNFERLPNLRLLEIISPHDIGGNFERSFHELRFIRWRHCPWTHLPSSFCPQKLVSLDMTFSKLKTLWKGTMFETKFPTGLDNYSSFTANLPNTEVAEWFSYKSNGRTVSLEIPPDLDDRFLEVALWIVYTCKTTNRFRPYIKAVFKNKTEVMKKSYCIYAPLNVVGEVHSRVECVRGDTISVKSGDRIKVSYQSLLYSTCDDGKEVPTGEVKVLTCAAL